LPPGYAFFWDGEFKNIVDALLSLVPGMGPAALIMAIIMVALFNAMRPVVVIVLALPFAIIGITGALLATSIPFGFMSVLGAMSLVGMLIKNAIVLIDEINLNRSQGASPYDSVVDAGVSRVRPVVLAALTTVLGVAPLLQDVFWISMSITIMAGLAFGTLITMVLVPTLYATLYRIPSPRRSGVAATTETTPQTE
jgi:multidrug efflux pump subunit AcrB